MTTPESTIRLISIVEKLNSYNSDEERDNIKYINLANELKALGFSNEANQIRGIADDEARHYDILKTIQSTIVIKLHEKKR